MPERFAFTKAAIDLLPAPAGLAVRYHDDGPRSVAHLVLRVHPSGARAFYWYGKVGGKPVEVKIGTYPATSIEVARRRAAEMNTIADAGQDPRAREPEGMTVGQLHRWWLEVKGPSLRPATVRNAEARWAHLKAWEARPLASITRADVRQLHAEITRGRRGFVAGQPGSGGPAMANAVAKHFRTMWRSARSHDLLEGDWPGAGMPLHPERSRERRLDPSEMAAFFRALDDTSEAVRDFVLLCLFTGARRANVVGMRWADVDMAAATWRIPAGDAKAGRSMAVPLLAQELEILARRQAGPAGRSAWVFPSRWGPKRLAGEPMAPPNRHWRELREAAGLPDLTIHDLRRSLGSFMADAGASLPMIGRALGHTSPSSTAIYARLSLDPLREAKGLAHARILEAGRPRPE